jgi:hypothetical protein
MTDLDAEDEDIADPDATQPASDIEMGDANVEGVAEDTQLESDVEIKDPVVPTAKGSKALKSRKIAEARTPKHPSKLATNAQAQEATTYSPPKRKNRAAAEETSIPIETRKSTRKRTQKSMAEKEEEWEFDYPHVVPGEDDPYAA